MLTEKFAEAPCTPLTTNILEPVQTAEGQLLSVGAFTVLMGRQVAVDKSLGPITTGTGAGVGVALELGWELVSAIWFEDPAELSANEEIPEPQF